MIAECFHTTDYSQRDCWVADRLPDGRMKSVPNAIGHCMRNVDELGWILLVSEMPTPITWVALEGQAL